MHARWFRILLVFPNSGAIFRQLWRGATPAGRLYALMGLQLTDPAAYRDFAHFSVADQTLVTWWAGCTGWQVTVGSIAAEIATKSLAASFDMNAERALLDARQDSLDEAYRMTLGPCHSGVGWSPVELVRVVPWRSSDYISRSLVKRRAGRSAAR